MHSYYLYNFLTFFYMYSAMVLISVPVDPRPVYDSDVVEPEIPTDPIVYLICMCYIYAST